MQKPTKLPRDSNALAARIVALSTGQHIRVEADAVADFDDGKNPAAVSLGRLGGLKGGKARAQALTKEQRAEMAAAAAAARWKKTD